MRLLLLLTIALFICTIFCYIKRDHILPDVSDEARKKFDRYNLFEKISLVLGIIVGIIFLISM